jgi:hypothetical protein
VSLSLIHPTVRPAADWPRVVRGPWHPAFVATRGDALLDATMVCALHIDGELHHGWEYLSGYARNVDGRGLCLYQPPPIRIQDYPPGDHLVSVTVHAAEPEANAIGRVLARTEATVRFEHTAPVPREPTPPHPWAGHPVPHVGPFVVAPFGFGVREAIDRPAWRAQYLAAGLRTHTGTVAFAPKRTSLADWQTWWRERGLTQPEFLGGFREYFRDHPQVDVVLRWDDLVTQGWEETASNPDTPAICDFLLTAWQELTDGRVRWLRISDESAMALGSAAHPIAQRITEWLVPAGTRAGIPIAWSGGGSIPGVTNAAFATLTGAYDLYSLHGDGAERAHATGPSLPQVRRGHDHSWREYLPRVPATTPTMGLVSVCSWQFTKGDSDPTRGDFDPSVDFPHTGSGRAVGTTLAAWLKVLDGACGAGMYFDETEGYRAEKRRETFPRSVLPEPCQTGCSPFAPDGSAALAMWQAMGALQRCTDAIGPRLFDVLHDVPTLASGVRASRRGDGLLLLANTREVPAKVPLPDPVAETGTRHRLIGEAFTSTRLYRGTTHVTLAPGEGCALVVGAS